MKLFLRKIIFGGIGILLIVALPLFADEEGQVLSLSLKEATTLALKNNFDIQVYRLDQLIKEEDILLKSAVYDTTLEASYKYDEDRRETSSTLTGTRSTSVEQSFDLSKKLPTGTVLSLGAAHRREYTNSVWASVNPYHENSIEASLRQPLLKDAWGIQDRNNLKVTQLDIDNSGYTSQDKIESELGSAQKAYWLLALAQARIDLEREMEKAARRLYETSKDNFDTGIMEDAELFATAANLKERQRDVVLAKDNLNYAMNELRFKLNLPKDILIKAEDEVLFFDLQEIDDVKLINNAFFSRRDYKRVRNKIKRENLSLEMKQNALWPQLDVVGTFKKNNVDADFDNSLGDIFQGDNPEYIVAIEFTFSLENRKAKGEFNQKELEKAKAIINLKKVECLVLTSVNNAISRLKSAQEVARLQAKALEFQKRKYLAQEKRFKHGRSDTDRFIRYQQDFLKAKLDYLNSLYTYTAADIDLKLTLNTLLKETEG